MKKVRLFQRTDRPGWHVSWREDGRVRKRSFPNKKFAEHFAQFRYCELNSEVLYSTVDAPWDELTEKYLRTYDVRRLTTAAKYEASLTLRHFKRISNPFSSKRISQDLLDMFIIERARTAGDWTLNKDVQNLRAFLHWGQKRHYIKRDLEVNKIKTTPRDVIKLSSGQIHNLLIAAKDRSYCWYVRLVLAVTTGLRSGDIDRLQVGDIDFETNSLRSNSKKTRKSMAARPLPTNIIPVLTRFITNLPDGQELLLSGDSNTHKKWKAIRNRAGLPNLRFHDLRSVFCTSLQAQNVPLSVAQDLLEHSSASLTQKFYTNTEELRRPAIEKLPLKEWLVED
jgi:integrase